MVKRGERRSTRNKKNKENASTSNGTVTAAPKVKSKNKTKSKLKSTDNSNNSDLKGLTFGERQMMQQIVFDFLKSDKSCEELTGLTNAQRKEIHLFARQHGLKTRSRSCDGQRVLTISRNENLQQHIRLEEVVLNVSFRINVVLGIELEKVNHTGLPPLASYHEECGNQAGGLVALPRVPPPARLNRGIANEQRQLPIYKYRSKIVELLDMTQVLIVNGATGSGKSTQLPQYLLGNATDRRQPIRIIVSQPRRIAAISVSSRIAEERGETLGQTVGYIIRMESSFSSNTVLSLTTSGCLLRSLAMNGTELFANTTHLIIDEVHDRDLNTDFLLLAVKLELERNKSLKLILMSATMDLPALSRFFNNAPVLCVEGQSFNVRIYPLERILSMTGYMTPQMMALLGNNADNADQEQRLQAYLTAHHRREDENIDNAFIVSLLEMLASKGMKGAVIVYLPGYQDMTTLMDHLYETLPNGKIKVMLLHSQIDSVKQKEVFREYPNIQLKIVLSTNIGQTSITIPDLIYVIDTGRSKMKTYDVATGASQLACTWISQADAQQRTGRAGRCQDGICYRLYSTDKYNSFSRFVVPEMKRHTLDEICLLAKIAVPHQSIEQFLSHALDPPETNAISQACANLKLLDVLFDNENVTDLGRIIAELPLDVQLAKCLIYSVYYRCAGSVSIIAAFYSVRDPFVLPIDRSARNDQRKARDLFAIDCYSDSIGILQLFHEYVKATKKSHREVDNYCKQNFVCQKSMDLFVATVKTLRISLRRIINLSDISLATKYDHDMNLVRLSLTAGLYPKVVYIERSKSGRRRFITEGDPNVQLSRNSGMSFCLAKKPKSASIDWMIYIEKTLSAGQVTHIEHVTMISTLMVAIQCGQLAKLTELVPQKQDNVEDEDNDDEDEDEDEEEVEEDLFVKKSVLSLDSWINIIVDTELGEKLLKLRANIGREFQRFISTRDMETKHCQSAETVRKLLELDAPLSSLSATDICLSN